MTFPANSSGMTIFGAIGAAIASAFGWVARRTVKRIDYLEEHMVKQEQLNELRNERAYADELRTKVLDRIETKIENLATQINTMGRDMTRRIDGVKDSQK